MRFHLQHFSPFSSIFGPFWLNFLTCTIPKYCSGHFLISLGHSWPSYIPTKAVWLNWCFIFCIFHHFHQFLAQFGSIFWLELDQYLVLVIFWNQLDIPSHPTYPQKLFCSLLFTLKWPKIDFAIATQMNAIYKFLAPI